MTTRPELLRAELASIEAEDDFVAYKAKVADPKSKASRRDDEWTAKAEAMRAARAHYRNLSSLED